MTPTQHSVVATCVPGGSCSFAFKNGIESNCTGRSQNGAAAYTANGNNNNRCQVDCSNRGKRPTIHEAHALPFAALRIGTSGRIQYFDL